MNKLLKSLFSIHINIVVLVFMALSCAVATFIENDFGTLSAKSFIYNQTWFETIMLFLTIGIIFNIIWFKMYQKKKFFIFIIHFSFVFIFLGATLTRYFGYEAMITIPEQSMENKMYSQDEYIQVKINDKDVYDKKVMITQLSQTPFSYDTTLNNEKLTIKFEKYIKNATEKIVDTKEGKPLINILLSGIKGVESIDLKDKNSLETPFLTFSLNKKVTSDKPIVSFEVVKEKLYINPSIKATYFTKEFTQEGEIKAGEKTLLKKGFIYKLGQTQFMINEASVKGELKTVSSSELMPKEKQVDAIVLDINYKDYSKKVSLFKKANSNNGFEKRLVLQGNKIDLLWGEKELLLPFSIYLKDFRLFRYPGSNSPSAYESDIKIYDKKNSNTLEHTISMNNTLDYNGYRFFQTSYKKDESATILSVNKDPGKIPTYIGYTLLFVGLFLIFFVKNSRFSKLSKKKYTLEDIKNSYYLKKSSNLLAIFFIFSIFLQIPLYSNEDKKILNIDKSHATNFGALLVQDYQGRIKPINSLAIEIITKITGKNSIYNLDANQFFLSMMLYPDVWQEKKLIKIKNDKLKKVLGIKKDEKKFSFKDIYTTNGEYKLENYLETSNAKSLSKRDNFDKELIKIDEKLNIAYNLFTGDFLRVFPKEGDKNNKWLNINEAIKLKIAKNPDKIKTLIENYYFSLDKATVSKTSWDKVNTNLDAIKNYQKTLVPTDLLPSEIKIKAELFFNKYNIFQRLTSYYLLFGFLLLLIIFLNIFKDKIAISKYTKYVLFFLSLGFIFHTFGLALRWYIAGHAPWSNGYESMIYISWAIILSGIFFSRQSHLAVATTSILSGITLFVAHLSWLEPQITTLVPVLKSYWLTIHVSVITASYGFLALSALLGFISLLLFILLNKKNEDEKFFKIILSIKEANRINEMSIFFGIAFLIVGNFLGAIWANESWGRYWGWDPKETWTLISIIVYSIIIHLKYVKDLLSDYLFSVLTTLSYSCIVMTYFGVNYYLSGKHSYAAGDAIPIPTFIPVTFFILMIVIGLAYKNRRVI